MTITAQQAFSRLVDEHVRPPLKAHGFKKKALTFYRTVNGNYGLVHLQKSMKSTASSVEFTINLAVFSALLQEGLAAITWVPTVTGVPTETACHIRRRIGSLLPDRKDLWWGVRRESDAAEVGPVVASMIQELAFPFLDGCASDEGLRDYWLARPEGTLAPPEELALGVLLRDIGPRDALGPLLDRLRSSASGAVLLLAAVERLAASAHST